MPTLNTFEIKQFLTSGTTWTVDLTSPTEEYYIYGGGTMSGSSTMSGLGTPINGMELKIFYAGNFNLNGNNITIFGYPLTQQQAQIQCQIIARYNGSAWQVQINPDDGELNRVNSGVNTTALTNAGGTETLVSGIDKKYQIISGSGITLLGSWVWDGGGLPTAGDQFIVHFIADTIDLNGNNITIFGKSLTQLQATSGNILVIATYSGSSWDAALLWEYTTDTYRVMGSSADTSPDYLDVKVKNSVEVDSDKIQLVNDDPAPGNNYIYGTNGSGVKGYYPNTSFGSGLWEVGSGTLSAQTAGTGCDASGDRSVSEGSGTIASGHDSHAEGSATTSSGDASHAEGYITTSSGIASHAGGESSTASGDISFVHGNQCESSGNISFATGKNSKSHLFASRSHAAFTLLSSIYGATQEFKIQLGRTTTDATPTYLQLGDNTEFTIPEDCSISVEIDCVAVQTAGTSGTIGDTFRQKIKFAVKNIAGTCSIVPTAAVTLANYSVESGDVIYEIPFKDAAFGGSIAISVASQTLHIEATGEADKTIKWYANVKMDWIGYRNFTI